MYSPHGLLPTGQFGTPANGLAPMADPAAMAVAMQTAAAFGAPFFPQAPFPGLMFPPFAPGGFAPPSVFGPHAAAFGVGNPLGFMGSPLLSMDGSAEAAHVAAALEASQESRGAMLAGNGAMAVPNFALAAQLQAVSMATAAAAAAASAQAAAAAAAASVRGPRSKRHQSTFDVAPFPHETMSEGALNPPGCEVIADDLARLSLEDLHAAARSSDAPTTVFPTPPPANVDFNDLHSTKVVRVGLCKTRNAGTWVWTAFRGSVWVVPPPFKASMSLSGPAESTSAPAVAAEVKSDEVADSASNASTDLPADRLPRSPSEHRHFTVFCPPQAPDHIRLYLVHYKCLQCMGPEGDFHHSSNAPLPGPSTAQRTAPKDMFHMSHSAARRPADVKLGGMCCDLPWQAVAHVVTAVTGIRIHMVDVFAASQSGRCCLWLEDPAETDLLLRRLVGRLWMAPASHGYAVLAPDRDAKLWLQGYLAYLRGAGITRVPFPRHLLTAERWRLGAQKVPTGNK